METWNPSGPEGTGPQVKDVRRGGGMVRGTTEEWKNLEGSTHRGCQGHYRRWGRRKGGNRTGDEAGETGLRRESVWAKRYLGSSSRAEIHQAKGREAESGGSGRLCDQATQDWKRRGIIWSKKSGVAQSKGGGWGGSWDLAGGKERCRKQLKVGRG